MRIPNAVLKVQKPTLEEWLAFAERVGAHDAVVQAVAKDWDKLEASYMMMRG
jgi:hypothetical protein